METIWARLCQTMYETARYKGIDARRLKLTLKKKFWTQSSL